MPTMKKNSELTLTGFVFNKLTKQLGKPVDFELPDWFIKSNPRRYIFIRRNRYLSQKAKRRRFDDDGIFCTCTPSPESPCACGTDCLCELLLSSCSSACKCKGDCLNKPFQRRRGKKMKLVKTEKCGSGIVADEDIKRGEFVVEYVGEVIDDLLCEERLWIMKHRGETNFYLCEINRDMVIDATYKGNKSRYINHSCCPNTQMQKWISKGETRIGIFATRDIRKGEHLTYDYQFVQFGADQDCHCGAVGCRRKLGVRHIKPKTVACQVYQDGSLYKLEFLVLLTNQNAYRFALGSYWDKTPCKCESTFLGALFHQFAIGDGERGRTHTPWRPHTRVHLESIDRWNGGIGRVRGSQPSPQPHRTEFQHSRSPDRESRDSLRSHEDRRNHWDRYPWHQRPPPHHGDHFSRPPRAPKLLGTITDYV